MCKNFYIASNGERQHAYYIIVIGYEGKPVCKAAQEIFWEKNIENLILEVDKETVGKMREIEEE